jgi:sec-independent protein translocase protein TatC
MSLVDHLYELRYRLGIAMVGVAVGAIIGFWWFNNSVFGLPTLSDVILGPYCALPESMRFTPQPGQCKLLATAPFETFMLRLKVGTAVGAVLFSPIWLYQVWAFITPGLLDKERKFARIFVGLASLLFAAGAVLAYFVVPQGLLFMVGFGGPAFSTWLTGNEYIGFVLLMLVIFGISFEVPLVIVMLNRAGLVSYEKLRSWWRGIVFVLFVFAAIATPGQDPISMLALAGALSLLFGVAMVLCRAHDRTKAKKLEEQGLQGIGLDEASSIDPRPSSLDSEPSAVKHDDAT